MSEFKGLKSDENNRLKRVKNIKINTLKSYRIDLERKYTNGHDFCELILDETNKNFTVRLYGGEVYSYGFSNVTGDFVKHLITVFKDTDYLYKKLADFSKHSFLNMDETINNMRNYVLEERRKGLLSEEVARKAFEELDEFSKDEPISEGTYYDMFFNILSDKVKEEVFSDEPWNCDFIVHNKDKEVEVFCELVAPILADVLQYQLELNVR